MLKIKTVHILMAIGWLWLVGFSPAARAQAWTQNGIPAREEHTAIYRPATNTMIVFGGQTAPGNPGLNDLWESQNTAEGFTADLDWVLLQPAGTPPPARYGHSAVYDPNTDRMIVFGGALGAPSPCGNDVWVLLKATGPNGSESWVQLNPAGTSPPPRYRHTAVYDPGSNTMTVFGGSDCTDSFYLSDVWVLSHANGLGGVPAWTELAPAGFGPSPRESMTAIYDAASKAMTVFGGDQGSGVYLGDLWVLNIANGQGTPAWSEQAPSGSAPQARSGHTAVYDDANNRMTITGGTAGSAALGDTWVLTGANGQQGTPIWIELQVNPKPVPRYFHTAVYNPTTDRMVTFGGAPGQEGGPTDDHLFFLDKANGLQARDSHQAAEERLKSGR